MDSWTQRTRQDVVGTVRASLGDDEFDEKNDEHINGLSPISRLRLMLGYELGDREWAGVILGWAKACGIEIGKY